MSIIGVDIGGSHITAAIVRVDENKIEPSSYKRTKIDSHADAEQILSQWVQVIESVAQHSNLPIQVLGFAMPGPFDYPNGICLMKGVAKYENLYGLNIKEELANRLNIPKGKIQFRNDAEAFLAGEMTFGAGRGFKKGIGLTLGTGLGTSIFENQKAFDMGLGITHPMHNGVAEDYISTRWFVRRYQELTGLKIDGVKEMATLYPSDEAAQKVFLEFAKNISKFIEEFVHKFHPEVIVVGGNITAASDLFFPEIESQLLKLGHKITLTKAKLNEDAALMGAVTT